MRAVSLCLALVWALGCKEDEEAFELNGRRIAELAIATCSCSDSVSNQTCAVAYEASLSANLLAQVQAGRIRVDGALWTDCISELRACEEPDACAKVFKGTVPAKGACVTSQECAPGLRCVAEDASDAQCPSLGTCQKIKTFERGEPCDREGKCKGGDVCGVATSGEGQPDDQEQADEDGGTEPGGDDAGVVEPPGKAELICRRPLEEGDPCPVEALGQEGTLLCEAGTFCVPDGDEVVCGDPVEPEEPCTYGIGSGAVARAPCTKGYGCDAAGSGLCKPFDFPKGGDIGEDCDQMHPCLPGFVCIDDECASPLPNGSACDRDDQCAAECFEERCAPTYVACGIK